MGKRKNYSTRFRFLNIYQTKKNRYFIIKNSKNQRIIYKRKRQNTICVSKIDIDKKFSFFCDQLQFKKL